MEFIAPSAKNVDRAPTPGGTAVATVLSSIVRMVVLPGGDVDQPEPGGADITRQRGRKQSLSTTVGDIVKKGKTFYDGRMVVPTTSPAPRRRYGDELQAAILEACWDELVTTGYANLTMDSVARRAGTSEPVLYRRWANKDELVLASLQHYRTEHTVDLPDTGSLRGDLIAALTGMGATGGALFAVAAATAFGGLASRMGLTPEEVRDRIFGDQRTVRMQLIYARAAQRGEIDLDETDPAVLALPFDLVRHDLLMDPAPIPPTRIVTIVDTLFLPLVVSRSAATGGE
ncbi:TetR/AcrR family transcriptional regulator [Gordonia sp. NPDC003376]